MKIVCSIYESTHKAGMYLYVERAQGLQRVPEALRAIFGCGRHSFDLILTPQRQLAREDIHQVLKNLQEQGYHLQMPLELDACIEPLPEELNAV